MPLSQVIFMRRGDKIAFLSWSFRHPSFGSLHFRHSGHGRRLFGGHDPESTRLCNTLDSRVRGNPCCAAPNSWIPEWQLSYVLGPETPCDDHL